MQVSHDEQRDGETLPRVMFVHLHECENFVFPIAEHMEKMPCKVEKFCISWECRAEFSLLFKSTPSDENVLLVFILPEFSYYPKWPDWISNYSCLLKIRPDLRRVIFSPYPLEPDDKTASYFTEYFIQFARKKIFNNELEKFCAVHVTNYRLLHPDSDSVNWRSDWVWAEDHIKEKLAKTIHDLATNPKAKFENHVGSSHTYEVSTSRCW
jgi:hypothetical protein